MSGHVGGYTLLWTKILDSTIWLEDAATRLVWITLLAKKNKDGIVQMSVPGLAHVARVSVEECQAALVKFLSPDPYSSSKVEDGRRLRELPDGGGWQLINHDRYRYATEERRMYWREKKALGRAAKLKGKRQKQVQDAADGREERFVRAVEAGDEAQADRIAAEGLEELQG